MSSLAIPATLELRLRAIRQKRNASRLAGVVTVGAWLTGLAAVGTVAGGALLGTR